MTLTNFNEFKKLFRKIPKDRLEYVRFIPLRQNTKLPSVKGSWKEINLTYYEVKNKMGFGENIGIVCLPKGIMVWDFDVDNNGKTYEPKLVANLLDLETFTVQTRSKGLHFYFLNDSVYNTQDIIINDILIGELRANWSYILSPGSWVDAKDSIEGKYEVIRDKPILRLPDEYKDYFKEGNTTKSNKKFMDKTGKSMDEEQIKMIKEKRTIITYKDEWEKEDRRMKILAKIQKMRS